MTTSIGPPFNNGSPFYQFLTTTGNGSGTIDHVGNYSVTPSEVFIQPNSDETLLITSLILTIADDSTFDPTKYGAVNALTNGYDLVTRINGVTTGILRGNKIKTGFDIMGSGAAFHFVEMLKDRPLLQARFLLSSDLNSPIQLIGINSDRISVTLNDNFTGMIMNRFIVTGIKL